jgi:hypothetical protein
VLAGSPVELRAAAASDGVELDWDEGGAGVRATLFPTHDGSGRQQVALLERWVEPRVHIGQSILPLRRTYGDVAPGQPIALINSFGVVEIAVAEGRACDALGLSRGAPVVLRDAVGKR